MRSEPEVVALSFISEAACDALARDLERVAAGVGVRSTSALSQPEQERIRRPAHCWERVNHASSPMLYCSERSLLQHT